MKTYQDLEKTTDKAGFIIKAITEYKLSAPYYWAVEGDLYLRQKNSTIKKYQKLLYTVSGKTVPDNYTANHKCASNFFNRFITQENQYLLGNGVAFEKTDTKVALGNYRYEFDTQLQKIGKMALTTGVAYGFWNLDHLDIYSALEFIPLFDEENGSIKAGIRFWQIDLDKPLRATLFELDGYTEYIRKKGSGHLEILAPKRAYILKTRESKIDGTEIYDGENYPSFPVIPLYGNYNHQSELVGLKENIDCYDLIKSGFANDLDDASMIYWTLQNAGGMDDIDLAKFIEHMKTVKAAALDDEVAAEAHTLDVPYQSRETYLTRLENDMYNDARALNVQALAAGNITATAIRAAYQSLDDKVDEYEYCVIEFIKALLQLVGIEDSPTFKRNRVANMTEETTMVLQAGQYLDDETILKHLPFLSSDEIAGILERTAEEEVDRFGAIDDNDTNDEQQTTEENGATDKSPIPS